MPARGRAGAWGAGAPAAALRTATAAYHRYLADWLSGVFARLIWLTGANRFPVPSNLITIMVDVCASCRFTDIISEDIDESINMSPSIDRTRHQRHHVLDLTSDAAVDVLCRQDDATVFVVAFRVRSERVLRRSAVGPEPGRGQGLGAPWTPALLTRCEWPGREYHVSLPAPIAYSVLPSEVAKRPVRARFSLAPSGHSLARAVAASRPPRCAISKRSHRPLALVLQGEDTAASADSDRAASAATERDRLRPLSLGATRMNDSASRDRKSESCLQFLRGARNLSRRPRDKGRRERRSASARLDRGAHQTPE
ncbi:hypothetical protein SFRURICE_001979 [Spodoptera frugiperda]|nr:hypothetical protein SFRURICE_001979 [Spodoptera frugiperda]